MPKKRTYSPGESLDFSGLSIWREGIDVTNECTYKPPAGTKWGNDDCKTTVRAAFTNEECTFELKRRRHLLIPFLVVLLVAAIGGGAGTVWWAINQTAQNLNDDENGYGRINVSLASDMSLVEGGALRVNFIVTEPNNGFSERLEVEQDGQVVYRSAVVDPGYKLEWGQTSGAKPGAAVAAVYAVKNGMDIGAPTRVEVEITENR